ncbi:6-bladed beta-propeller [Aquiflexum gelatinilyticum]|uniref:6-bladed beta-propeller n=1 Tax=Aquiflexum gelatinilyticum TaxID=2961943 RepID=UPI002168A0F5|nr:6-bladed beta-propeller [Aquiflexum gelatinilyticum]MCS4433574.1 6-bladed beta-propeller [Aquiflexum gelatinilyticum]
MKYKYFKTAKILTSLIIWAISCTGPDKKTSGLISLSKSEEALQLGTYFSNFETVLFDQNQLIGQIDKLVVTDSLIVLTDFDLLKSIKVFNRQGEFMASKDDFGDDPLAMGYFDDFEVFEGKIYVLDGNKRKIYVFDLGLNLLDEIAISNPASAFLINRNGIFLYQMIGNPDFPFQLSFLSHSGKEAKGLISFNPKLAESPFSGSFFVKMNEEQFVHYNPGLDSIYLFSGEKHESFKIDFGTQFIDLNQSKDLHPVERLRFYNDFEGYKQLSFGVKVGEGLILFGLSYENKPHYLLVDLENQKSTLFKTIKNNLKPLPSTIFFAANSDKHAWYYQSAEQIEKFYELNESKISLENRIELPEDIESNVLVLLDY